MIRWHALAPDYLRHLSSVVQPDVIFVDDVKVPVKDAAALVRDGLSSTAARHEHKLVAEVRLCALIAAGRADVLQGFVTEIGRYGDAITLAAAAHLRGDADGARRHLAAGVIRRPAACFAAAFAAWLDDKEAARRAALASRLFWGPGFMTSRFNDGDAARVVALLCGDRAAGSRMLAESLQGRNTERALVDSAEAAHAIGDAAACREGLAKAAKLRPGPVAALAHFAVLGDAAAARKLFAAARDRARRCADWLDLAACLALMPGAAGEREAALAEAERAADNPTDWRYLTIEADGARLRRAGKIAAARGALIGPRNATSTAEFIDLAAGATKSAARMHLATAETRAVDPMERLRVAIAWDRIGGDADRAAAVRRRTEAGVTDDYLWRSCADDWAAAGDRVGTRRCLKAMAAGTDRIDLAEARFQHGDDAGFREALRAAETEATERTALARIAMVWAWAGRDDAAARRCLDRTLAMEPGQFSELPPLHEVWIAALGDRENAQREAGRARPAMQGPIAASHLIVTLGDVQGARRTLEMQSGQGGSPTHLSMCAEDWLGLFGDGPRARRLMEDATSAAKDFFDMSQTAETWWTLLGDSAKAGALLDRASKKIRGVDALRSLADREVVIRGPGKRVDALRRRYLKAVKEPGDLLSASELAQSCLGDAKASRALLARAGKAAASVWEMRSAAQAWIARFGDAGRARKALDRAAATGQESIEVARDYVRLLGDSNKARVILSKALKSATEDFQRDDVRKAWREIFGELPD